MSRASAQALPGSQRLPQTLSALRHRNYRLHWFGQLFSVLAQNMEYLAQGWLVLEITNSPLLLGLTGLAWELTPLGGTIAGAVAEFAGAPIAVIMGGAPVTGTALAVIILKQKMMRWEAY